MDSGTAGPTGGSAENWSRQDGIRAGAVSGPWRSAGRPSRVGAASGSGGAGHAELMDDIPAPILRAEADRRAPAAPEPVRIPVLLEDDFSDLMADTRPLAVGNPAGRSPILGAVLFGGVIAIGIVALAFLLRP